MENYENNTLAMFSSLVQRPMVMTHCCECPTGKFTKNSGKACFFVVVSSYFFCNSALTSQTLNAAKSRYICMLLQMKFLAENSLPTSKIVKKLLEGFCPGEPWEGPSFPEAPWKNKFGREKMFLGPSVSKAWGKLGKKLVANFIPWALPLAEKHRCSTKKKLGDVFC